MSYIRSTEKSLTMLCFSANTLMTKSQRSHSTTKLANFYINKKPQRRFFSSGTSTNAFRRYGRPVKARKFNLIVAPQERHLATERSLSLQTKPLLNPDKSDASDAVIQPIVPLTHPKFDKKTVETPSVTRVLSATMPAKSRFMLDRWKEGMIKKLGVAGFSQYQKDTFERGTVLHSILAKYLLGQGEPTNVGEKRTKEIVNNLWKSIEPVVREKLSNIRLVEHTVTYAEMNYRGIVDCVGFYDKELVVIDFKTSEKPKKSVDSLYDNPVQVAAYCGAINNDPTIPKHVIDRNICSGVVIVAYCDGSPATTYYLDSDKVANTYWKQWVSRLDQYSRMAEMIKVEKTEEAAKRSDT